MAKYKITDPQSNRSMVVSGDSPPSESDIDSLFEQAGIRQPHTVSQNLQRNPIANFILGNSLRTSQDISSGINANMTEKTRTKRNDDAFKQAKKLEESAQVTSDPMVKKRFLSQANDLYKQVSKAEGEVSKSFSPDVYQNPAWRGFKSGGEIGALADEIINLPAQLQSVYKAGNALLHPFQTVSNMKQAAIDQADKLGNALDMQKVLSTVKNARTSTPATDLPTFDTNIEKLASQAKDTPYMSTNDAAQLYHNLNQAFTRGGLPKSGADNAFDLLEKSAVKTQLPKDVLDTNKLFQYLYGAKGFAKKLTSPLVLGPAAAAVGGSYTLAKILGSLSK